MPGGAGARSGEPDAPSGPAGAPTCAPTPGRALAALVLAALAVGGCTASPPEDPPRATYRCDDGTTFTAEFVRDTAIVAIRRDTFRLPIAISASGARYTDGTITFWEHQGAARLILPDTTHEGCPIVDR